MRHLEAPWALWDVVAESLGRLITRLSTVLTGSRKACLKLDSRFTIDPFLANNDYAQLVFPLFFEKYSIAGNYLGWIIVIKIKVSDQ
jgi:hypothetical protein